MVQGLEREVSKLLAARSTLNFGIFRAILSRRSLALESPISSNLGTLRWEWGWPAVAQKPIQFPLISFYTYVNLPVLSVGYRGE